MSVQRLFYITCDRCGCPAGTDHDLGDTAKEARSRARVWGFVRVETEGRWEDVCPKCA